MLNSVTGILVLAAFVTAICSILDKCPLWVSVILVCVAMFLLVAPGMGVR